MTGFDVLKPFLKKTITFLTFGKYVLKNREQLCIKNSYFDSLEKQNIALISKEKELRATLKIKEVELKQSKKNAIDYVYPHATADNFFRCLDLSPKKKRVLLVGWYGANNLGDELMLSVLLEELCRHDNYELAVILDRSERYKVTSTSSVFLLPTQR